MTVTAADLALYAGAMLILFLTPGPVWMALIARAMAGGFAAAWPLALGVALGDMVWPLVAVVGVSWLVTEIDGFMTILRLVASAVFIGLGAMVIRHADLRIEKNRSLTRPGRMAGFLAGVAVILGNPKAILFYMGVLPGFFDLAAITRADVAAIVALSFAIPLLGNLCFAVLVDRMRRFVASPAALRRTNLTAGTLLICVGLVIPFT